MENNNNFMNQFENLSFLQESLKDAYKIRQTNH